jgi:5-methyltetrahydropteroyltriglutamate--homocysteine methyltransferase
MPVDRIASTHTGSLPRSAEMVKLMFAVADGVPVDQAALDAAIADAIDDVVRRQIDAGITVINDGEQSKPSYATYVKERLGGFDGDSVQHYIFRDIDEFPGSWDLVASNPGRRKRTAPSCTRPITVQRPDMAVRDMEQLTEIADRHQHRAGLFSSAASPGVVSLFFANDYYPTHEEYVFAIADAMTHEYEAIAAAGAVVQLDCPDLAMGRHSSYAALDDDEWRRTITINMEALNHAVRNVPVDQLRLHVCWGNYQGPHHCDVPIGQIAEVLFRARPRTILFEAANPRHAHEWTTWADLDIPGDITLCPGVIEPLSTYIEHPEVVAQRIGHFVDIVGPERVMAGVDCGFSIHVGSHSVDRDVIFAKLAALAHGCELAAARS